MFKLVVPKKEKALYNIYDRMAFSTQIKQWQIELL